jgi:hypothetical protein
MEALEMLPRGTLAALEQAVEAAREWRGYYANDGDALQKYDAQLKRMRDALVAVKRQQRALRYMMDIMAVRQIKESGKSGLH